MRALVTGANGFVGRAVCERLLRASASVVGAVRAAGTPLPAGVEPAVIGDVAEADWNRALQGVTCVVHLAARVHQMRDEASDPLAAYRRVNTVATERLATAAAGSGVARLVFMSSVKVMGEGRPEPYTDDTPPAPADPYAVSKLEAEQCLRRIERETGLQVVVLRPPLVYGPGVRANFLRLVQLVRRGVPLPFGAIQNRRSLVYVGNLADAVHACCTSPVAAGQTYFISDGEDVSTPELVRRLALSMGAAPRLLPVPPAAMRILARVLRKAPAANRLLGSMAVDARAIRDQLGWSPPFSLDSALSLTTERFRRAAKA
jgi:nucleoside-diphosphate-sugar epimerase